MGRAELFHVEAEGNTLGGKTLGEEDHKERLARDEEEELERESRTGAQEVDGEQLEKEEHDKRSWRRWMMTRRMTAGEPEQSWTFL